MVPEGVYSLRYSHLFIHQLKIHQINLSLSLRSIQAFACQFVHCSLRILLWVDSLIHVLPASNTWDFRNKKTKQHPNFGTEKVPFLNMIFATKKEKKEPQKGHLLGVLPLHRTPRRTSTLDFGKRESNSKALSMASEQVCLGEWYGWSNDFYILYIFNNIYIIYF